MTIETIDRMKLRRLINNANGKFFTVDYRKKDGTLRTMTCRLGVASNLKGGTNTIDMKTHLEVIYEATKRQYRTINLSTIFRVRVGGTYYKVEG